MAAAAWRNHGVTLLPATANRIWSLFLRLRTKVYRHSQRRVKSLPNWVRAAHSIFWLHLLGNRDLDDLTMASYSTPSDSGFGSEAHNVGGLHSWEEDAFGEALAGRRRILVAGAGGGREMIALAKIGFEVTGFDASEDLIWACRENLRKAGVIAEILAASPGAVPNSAERHDALVVGRGVYHHIPGRAKRIGFLRSCGALLDKGAPMVMGDVLTRSDTAYRRLLAAVTAIEQGDSVSNSYYHYFTPDELRDEIEEAGFVMLDYRVTPVPGNMAHVVARWSP